MIEAIQEPQKTEIKNDRGVRDDDHREPIARRVSRGVSATREIEEDVAHWNVSQGGEVRK
jgi:hypothetical protein